MDKQMIITAIISAGLGAFVAGIFQLINRIIDICKEKKFDNEQSKKIFYEKREQAYKYAIHKLLFIRKGFDITREMLRKNEVLRKEYEDEINSFKSTDPTIRLYASDLVFQQYYNLLAYKVYSYTSENNCWRLGEDSKNAYDLKLTILSRLMQQDLGFRQYENEPEIIMCPVCGREHDIVGTCSCGLTFKQLQIELDKILKQAQGLLKEQNENEVNT